MDTLKNKFEKLYSKYTARKEFFRKVVAKLGHKGPEDLFKRGTSLLSQAEVLCKEIAEGFVITVENQPNEIEMRSKYRSLKKIYKELVEITKPAWRQWIEAIVVAGGLVFVLRTFVFGLYHVPTGSAEPTILVGDRIFGNKMCYYVGKINRGDCVIFDSPEFVYDKSNSINYFWQKYIGFGIPLLGLSNGPENWVKRVIAVPGDTIEGRVEDGKAVIYINGQKLDETFYVNPYPLIGLAKTTGFFPISLPLSFLSKQARYVYYTYDPEKSFKDQPFYHMTKKEVIRSFDGQFFLRMPYSPGEEDVFGPIRVPAGKYWVMGDSRKNSRDSRFWGFLDESLIHGRASFVIYSVDSEEPLWLFELIKHPIDFWTKYLRWNRFFKTIK